jgi:hypothetical protein
MSESKSVTCDCGHAFSIVKTVCEWTDELTWPVCDTECPKCDRRSTGGNGNTGEITCWITEADACASEQEYQRQLFDSDMNEWYGRGEW